MLDRARLGPFEPGEGEGGVEGGVEGEGEGGARAYNTMTRKLLRRSEYRKALVKSWQFSNYGAPGYIICEDAIHKLVYLMVYKGANNMIRANLVEDRPDKLRMREEELERAARKGSSNRRRPRPPRTPGKYDADVDVQTDCKNFRDFEWSKVLDPDGSFPEKAPLRGNAGSCPGAAD